MPSSGGALETAIARAIHVYGDCTGHVPLHDEQGFLEGLSGEVKIVVEGADGWFRYLDARIAGRRPQQDVLLHPHVAASG
jgi:hypothetical protein